MDFRCVVDAPMLPVRAEPLDVSTVGGFLAIDGQQWLANDGVGFRHVEGDGVGPGTVFRLVSSKHLAVEVDLTIDDRGAVLIDARDGSRRRSATGEVLGLDGVRQGRIRSDLRVLAGNLAYDADSGERFQVRGELEWLSVEGTLRLSERGSKTEVHAELSVRGRGRWRPLAAPMLAGVGVLLNHWGREYFRHWAEQLVRQETHEEAAARRRTAENEGLRAELDGRLDELERDLEELAAEARRLRWRPWGRFLFTRVLTRRFGTSSVRSNHRAPSLLSVLMYSSRASSWSDEVERLSIVDLLPGPYERGSPVDCTRHARTELEALRGQADSILDEEWPSVTSWLLDRDLHHLSRRLGRPRVPARVGASAVLSAEAAVSRVGLAEETPPTPSIAAGLLADLDWLRTPMGTWRVLRGELDDETSGHLRTLWRDLMALGGSARGDRSR